MHSFVSAEPETRSTLIGRAVENGVSRWAADNLLRMADTDGLLARTGSGKRGDPYLYRCAQRPQTSAEGKA